MHERCTTILRLEKDGVLKSWAVPKGIPEKCGRAAFGGGNRGSPLRIRVVLKVTIPKGQYGAGTVKIWDKGYYEPKLWENDKIEVTLNGEGLKGRYVLVRLKRAKDDKSGCC